MPARVQAISIFFLIAGSFFRCSEKEQWRVLFDGTSLNGWEQKGGKAQFFVENNSIVGVTAEDPDNSYLCTNEVFTDFILELELKVDTSMNSGIQFRSRSDKDYKGGRVYGHQMEVDPSVRSWSGGIYDEARRGWIYSLENNPQGKSAFKNGEWNHYRIEACGNQIRTYVNFVPTADLIDSINHSGFIALQVHGISPYYKEKTPGVMIYWRNIRILTDNIAENCIHPDGDIPQINLTRMQK